MEHPYFDLTLPHLRAAARLPRIPFSQGQPPLATLTEMLGQVEQQRQGAQQVPRGITSPSTSSLRSVPPSHSHSHSHSPSQSKPAFGADGGRTLPPLHMDRHGSSPSAGLDSHHSGHSSSHILQTQVPAKSGASALVDQLRELDLPTADLASYGHRAHSPDSGSHVASWLAKGAPALGPVLPPPQERSQNYQVSSDSHAYRQQQERFEQGPAASVQQSTALPSDSAFARSHLPPHMVTPTALASSSSADFTSDPYGRPMNVVPEAAEDVEMAVDVPEPPAVYEQRPTHPSPFVPQQPTVKKKKWGLGSVFGHGSSSDHKQVVEAQASLLSLKRTQSGSIADGRAVPAAAPPPTNMDPRKAKKEAEKQAKELERAKREAAERAQKERARAVMQKRTVLEQERKKAGAKTEFEWSSVEKPSAPSGGPAGGKGLFGLANTSVRSHGDGMRGHDEGPAYGGSSDGSRSQSSLQQAPSVAHSRLSGQSLQALQAQGSPLLEAAKANASRAKARRRDDDDDHSTSSIASSHHHMMSTATIDSE